MAFAFYYPHLIGTQNPISFALTRTLNRSNIPFKQVSLQSDERQSAVLASKPIFVLIPDFLNSEEIDLSQQWLAEACAADIPVILLSSLAVLQTEGTTELDESVQNYRQDEHAIALRHLEQEVQTLNKSIVLRTGQLLTLKETGILRELLKRKEQNTSLILNQKQLFSPTPVNQAAEVIVAILKQISCVDTLWGLYHYGGNQAISLYALADCFFHLLQENEDFQLSLIASSEEDSWFTTYGIAPVDSSRLFASFGIRPKPWREGIQRIVDFYYGKSS